ncbi:UNVERIFIED_CONTAM: hypothetical protein Slati_2841800 [Sesamum latifolium]|uniref:Ribosomal RNA-processing protein 14 N-terminal domain-containing protein n=1 Tax=Sesamum latifolium TaxID=2727402 RepID=A0AAW2VAE4_9LAMI
MKKKKQKPTTPNPAADEFGGDLKSIIHAHSEYFDHLIELIPPRFYLSHDDADSKPWYQGLSKAAKASLKQQSKQNLKLARRQRFDPDKEPSSTLQLLQQQQNSKTPVPDEGNFTNLEDGESGAKPIDVEENKEKSVTYEELREKLRRKIELLRGNRGEKKNDEKKVKNDGNKRKRGGENEEERMMDGEGRKRRKQGKKEEIEGRRGEGGTEEEIEPRSWRGEENRGSEGEE